MNTITKSAEEMINSLNELDLDMNPEMINNPQEIFTNISEVEGLDPNQIFGNLAAPLNLKH